MLGYWNKPEATAEMIRNGWLHSGDIAVMDEDGYFFIVDRMKDMILVNGFNVYPTEVEDVLFHHPKILKCAVIGVPDERSGERVKAFVVLKPGESATAEEIVAWCRDPAQGLTGYRVPREIEFRDSLPETMIGKVLRRVLQEEERAKAAAGRAPPRHPRREPHLLADRRPGGRSHPHARRRRGRLPRHRREPRPAAPVHAVGGDDPFAGRRTRVHRAIARVADRPGGQRDLGRGGVRRERGLRVDTEMNTGEIGYWNVRAFEGHGLITKACRLFIDHGFRERKLHRIEIHAAADNLRSRAVAERLGFTHEATMRDGHRKPDDTYVDQVVYGLLEHEWPAT